MKRLVLISALIFTLAACMPADLSAPEYNPYRAVEFGELAAAQGRADIQATSDAQQRRMAEATLQAAREQDKTEQEVARIQAEIQGTQAAVSAQATQAAIAYAQDVATQQAQATSVAYIAAQTPAAATQTALERQVRIDAAGEKRAAVMGWAILVAAVIGILYIAWQVGEFIAWRTEIMVRSANVRESRAGTIVYKDDYWVLLSDEALIRRLNVKSDLPVVDAVEFSPGRITATSESGNGDRRKLAIDLVRESIAHGNAGGNMIVSHHQLSGWNSFRWSEAVRFLKDLGAIETVEKQGTFLRKYDSLSDLLYVLETDQVSPAPR